MFGSYDVTTAPAGQPVTRDEAIAYIGLKATATDPELALLDDLIAGVTLQAQHLMWRAVMRQVRTYHWHGELPDLLEAPEPFSAVAITRWTPGDAAEEVPASTYTSVPGQAYIELLEGETWPQPRRRAASFSLALTCGWTVADFPKDLKVEILRNVRAQWTRRDEFAVMTQDTRLVRVPYQIRHVARRLAIRRAVVGGPVP